jgi:DNA topoisomerase VI subunit A
MATKEWRQDPKNQDRIKKSKRDYYYRNKESELARIRQRKQTIKEWFKEFKSTLKCKECGQDHPATLQFHHRDPNEKEISLAQMGSSGWSIDRIKVEINKCDVLCANCHFIHHWKE